MSEVSVGTFGRLMEKARETMGSLTDGRKESNARRYEMRAAGMSGLSIFMMQDPSFLNFQRRLEESRGSGNFETIFCGDKIPSDNQIRNLLDGVDPSEFSGLFDFGLEALSESGALNRFKTHDGFYLAAIDGTEYHSSSKINCEFCCRKEIKIKAKKRNKNVSVSDATPELEESVRINYFHSVLAAAIVAPGINEAIPLIPEFVVPQDGHEKQDCENAAAKRWIKKHADRYRKLNLVLLGDDLMSREPICRAVKEAEMGFIFVCKPQSHKTLYEYVGRLAERKTVRIERNGKKIRVDYRFMNDLPLKDGKDAMRVNWMDIRETDEKTKNVIYRNSFVADIEITKYNVKMMTEYGRARWKIENENNNTLKTKGYCFEHNYGHGKKTLASVFSSLAIIAFLFHTVMNLIDSLYIAAKKKAGTRKGFFETLKALTSYFVFDSWDLLMRFVLDPDDPVAQPRR